MSELKYALDWKLLDQEDCCSNLYEIGGALRAMGKFRQAARIEKVANELFPGAIKPIPIVPKTTHG